MKRLRNKCILTFLLAGLTCATPFGSAFGGTMALHGMNWADPVNNSAEYPILSGMWNGITKEQTYTLAKTIGAAVKSAQGTTVRMPVGLGFVRSQPYQATMTNAIKGVLDSGCNVILCYWIAGAAGRIPSADYSTWKTLWSEVNRMYGADYRVKFEPINEPYGYGASELANLYWNDCVNRLNKTSWKWILDGNGYAQQVYSLAKDSRLSSQYLGLHCYWWFSSSTTNINWSYHYNKMKELVGTNNAYRTIVTEIGVQSDQPWPQFVPTWGDAPRVDVAYLTGTLGFARDYDMGTITWSGATDGDGYRWFNSTGNLSEINPDLANTYRWGWKLYTY